MTGWGHGSRYFWQCLILVFQLVWSGFLPHLSLLSAFRHVCPCTQQTQNKCQGFRLSTTAAQSANSKKMLDQALKKKKITLKPTPGSRSCQSNEEVKKRREGRSCFHPKGFCQAWQMWMSILITCEGREMKIKVQGDLPHNYDPMGLPSGLSWARNQAALARTSARSAWGAGGSSSLNFRLAVPESSVPTKKAERKAPLLERRTSHQSCKLLL